MASTIVTLASDAVVLGVAASAVGLGMGMKSLAPFQSALGDDEADDSLVEALEVQHAAPLKVALPPQAMKAPVNVTVSEVAITPPVNEVHEIFPAA